MTSYAKGNNGAGFGRDDRVRQSKATPTSYPIRCRLLTRFA
jgi:hypothetical protein